MKYLNPSLSSWLANLTPVSHEAPSALSNIFIDKAYPNGGNYEEAKRNNNKSSLMKFYDKLERKTTSSFKIKSLCFQYPKPTFIGKHVFILNICHPRVADVNETWPESFIHEVIK